MISLVSTLIFAVLLTGPHGQPDQAAAIIRKSEERVRILEQKTDSLDGTMKAAVEFSSNVLGKKASGKSVYLIYVEDGLDARNMLVDSSVSSDSMVNRMMRRESERRINKPILKVFDAAFPWERYLASGSRKRRFSAELLSDTDSLSGKSCYRLSFELDAEGDSVSASGKGEIWIDTKSLLPVKTYRDFTVETKRGRAEVKTRSDFGLLENGVPVLLRTEVQTIPRFLFIGIGFIRITIEQSDFKLE